MEKPCLKIRLEITLTVFHPELKIYQIDRTMTFNTERNVHCWRGNYSLLAWKIEKLDAFILNQLCAILAAFQLIGLYHCQNFFFSQQRVKLYLFYELAGCLSWTSEWLLFSAEIRCFQVDRRSQSELRNIPAQRWCHCFGWNFQCFSPCTGIFLHKGTPE